MNEPTRCGLVAYQAYQAWQLAEYLPARIVIHPLGFVPGDKTYCDHCGLLVADQVHTINP